MTNNSHDSARSVHRLEVVVEHSHPKIIRRLEVPSTTRLEQLHEVFQVVMGWEDTHPFRFSRVDDLSANASLAEVAPSTEGFIEYVYDVPDAYGIGGWKLEITIVKIIERRTALRSPRCTSGHRAGPPQNCGGIFLYHFLLSLSASERRQRGDSFRRGFKPGFFDKAAANKKLNTMLSLR